MANTILTPVTLWRDFDDSLPFEQEIVSEKRERGVISRELFIKGRKTAKGRVKIYCRHVFPEGAEQYPAVLVLFEMGFPFDDELVRLFTDEGYGVLCVDYCGDRGAEGLHTVYPEDIDYGNFARVGRHIDYAEPTARETSWYEWAGVARYAARFLDSLPEVTKVGAVGLRAGGEVLFKISPYAPIACMVSVCAAGWLAYRGVDRFGEGDSQAFDGERHRFIAGIDSQSYAPYAKCPVLLLSAINDPKCNYGRVYDTFRQINPDVEKAILFSAHGNGLIGSHCMRDMMLFLDKFLKERSVFISKPVEIDVGEDGNGNLVVRSEFDGDGEIKEHGFFFTERSAGGTSRDWTRVLGTPKQLSDNTGEIPLNYYFGNERALVYSFVTYSNNFSVTSKILEVVLDKRYTNRCPKSRVIYTSKDGLNGFTGYRARGNAIADCFAAGAHAELKLLPGYGGILGASCRTGLVSYRVGESRYEPPTGAAFRFDAWASVPTKLRVIFYRDDTETKGYAATEHVEGGGKWKNILFDADDFKAEDGSSLGDFQGVVSVVILAEEELLVNNVLWI